MPTPNVFALLYEQGAAPSSVEKSSADSLNVSGATSTTIVKTLLVNSVDTILAVSEAVGSSSATVTASETLLAISAEGVTTYSERGAAETIDLTFGEDAFFVKNVTVGETLLSISESGIKNQLVAKNSTAGLIINIGTSAAIDQGVNASDPLALALQDQLSSLSGSVTAAATVLAIDEETGIAGTLTRSESLLAISESSFAAFSIQSVDALNTSLLSQVADTGISLISSDEFLSIVDVISVGSASVTSDDYLSVKMEALGVHPGRPRVVRVWHNGRWTYCYMRVWSREERAWVLVEPRYFDPMDDTWK